MQHDAMLPPTAPPREARSAIKIARKHTVPLPPVNCSQKWASPP